MTPVAVEPTPPAQTTDATAAHRPIRTFVKRGGRGTTGQARALELLGPGLIVPHQQHAIDWIAVFADAAGPDSQFVTNPRRRVFEIGFGMGDATAQIAEADPDSDFLCCDVHEPGIGALLQHIDRLGLRNVRICAHDAVEVLRDMLPHQSLDAIHIFFPDPWPKARHHKRRLIQPPLVHALSLRLKAGGTLHCATDWQPYAEQMLQVLEGESLLHNPWRAQAPELAGYAPRPAYRPLTKFERRGQRLGHGVWDLLFTRT